MIKFSLKRFQWYRILFPTLTSPAALCRGNDTQHFGVCPQPPSRGLVFLRLIDIWVVFQFSLVPTSLPSSMTISGVTVKLSFEEHELDFWQSYMAKIR